MSQDIQSYLTFSIANNIFGVHVSKVVEIQEYSKPKTVPESMAYVKGVIDHRAEIIPVIDTAVKFNLGEVSITPQTCIVVLEVDKADGNVFHLGIMVDAVTDVFESDPEKVKSLENDFKPGYISTTYKIEGNLVMILDSNKVFTEKDIIALDAIISELK